MVKRNEFGTNWWARRWIAVLESFGWDSRLQRGRSYARGGHVRSIEVAGSRVTARVQGTQPSPYRVVIEMKPLRPKEWQQVLEKLASQALFAAKLLAGEMPQDIEEVFQSAGVALFPSSSQELETHCSCPDWANPCKHVAAVHYLLGAEFDREPFLLFQLRGRSKDEIIRALRALRAGQGDAVSPVPLPAEEPDGSAMPSLDDLVEQFWVDGEELSSLSTAPGRGAIDGVMRLLGAPLPFNGEPEPMFALSNAYNRVARRALQVAYGDAEAIPRRKH